jgi:uncharacterized RDD family membrane protein YckC
MPRVEELKARGVLPPDWTPAPVVTLSRPYAGFWHRAMALLLDCFALAVVAGIPVAIVLDGRAESMAMALVGPVYFWYVNSQGGTFGKQALALKVVDADGHPPGLRRGAWRAAVNFAFLVAVILPGDLGATAEAAVVVIGFVDVLAMVFDEYRQTFHDRLAGTYVVRV